MQVGFMAFRVNARSKAFWRAVKAQLSTARHPNDQKVLNMILISPERHGVSLDLTPRWVRRVLFLLIFSFDFRHSFRRINSLHNTRIYCFSGPVSSRNYDDGKYEANAQYAERRNPQLDRLSCQFRWAPQSGSRPCSKIRAIEERGT